MNRSQIITPIARRTGQTTLTCLVMAGILLSLQQYHLRANAHKVLTQSPQTISALAICKNLGEECAPLSPPQFYAGKPKLPSQTSILRKTVEVDCQMNTWQYRFVFNEKTGHLAQVYGTNTQPGDEQNPAVISPVDSSEEAVRTGIQRIKELQILPADHPVQVKGTATFRKNQNTWAVVLRVQDTRSKQTYPVSVTLSRYGGMPLLVCDRHELLESETI